ncbi:MAG: homoserine dehydrogenase [Chloroflexi bacterium]|nr:homoserine dehydrogenase [Chloroflexota bacterium]
MTQTIRFALLGLGNIGRNLLNVLEHRRDKIYSRYGLDFILTAACDSSGAALSDSGLDLAALRDLKLARRGAAELPGIGLAGMRAREVLQRAAYDLVVDASPTNLQDGEPGLSCLRDALTAGKHAVLANKGPLVLAYNELTRLAAAHNTKLFFSGTVAGGLPTVNLGVRDLAGSGVIRVEGIFNGTTNYILTRMEGEGLTYEEALRGAQEAGIVEPDPSLDVDGWDAASKLVIIANSVLQQPTRLNDLQVTGIRELTQQDLAAARAQGKVIKLLALAEARGDGYALSVRPTALPQEHILARTGLWDMGVVYETDYMGVISAVIEEKGPVPTSAAVLRDMINIYRD